MSIFAEVAELADALRSGRSECTLMRVQIPPSAQRPFNGKVFFMKELGKANCWIDARFSAGIIKNYWYT